MKKALAILSLLLVSATASAQGWQVANPVGTARALPTPGTALNRANADTFGNAIVSLAAGASAATNPVKIEDSPAATGDAGMAALGVQNDSYATLAATGDYIPLATGRAGNQLSTLVLDDILAGTRQLAKVEDVAAASGDALMPAGALIAGSLAATAADGDYTYLKTNLFSALYTQDVAGTAGGGTVFSAISAASNNATAIKASNGQVYSVQACNSNAAARYVKLYNLTTVTDCGASAEFMRFMVPAANCINFSIPAGAAFSTGISMCIVTGAADADNTSTAANEQTVNITFR
jgi:hypothetical protein